MSSADHDRVLVGFHQWYEAQRKGDGPPSRGVIAAALQVLEDLRETCDLRVEAHLTGNEGQVRGLGGERLMAILRRLGVHQVFLKEGGRTSRGVMGPIRQMLGVLDETGLGRLPTDERNRAIGETQAVLKGGVQQHMDREKLKFVYDPSRSTYASVTRLLDTSRQKGCFGPVAEYLVGAKLQLRFPDVVVRNTSFSTSDDQTGEPGDFRIGATSFHVTVSPQPAVYAKCQRNVDAGLRAYLIVPQTDAVIVRYNADHVVTGAITVCSLECFVAGNIDELATFDMPTSQFRLLLETYNQRVGAVETDMSLLIEIPANL